MRFMRAFFLCVVVVVFARPVMAQSAPTIHYFMSGQYYPSALEACQAWAATWTTGLATFYGSVYVDPSEDCRTTSNNGWNPTSKQLRCRPDGSAPVNGVCPVVDPPNPCKDKQGQTANLRYTVETASGQNVSPPVRGSTDGMCEVTLVDVASCHKMSDGSSQCVFVGRYTGVAKASGGDAPPALGSGEDPKGRPRIDVPPFSAGDSNTSCPRGTVQGGVDSSGIPICMGTGSAPRNPPSTPPVTTSPPVVTTNPDGSSTTTVTTTQVNADGSTTTTVQKTTQAPDGTKTVTKDASTSKTPSGSDGQADDPEKSDLCKQNPSLTICRNSSVSGTCGDISCQGDAIQCATLRAAAQMQCQQQADIDELKGSPLQTLGASIVAGADPAQAAIDEMRVGTVVDLSAPQLDQSGFAPAACLSPRTFTVLGQSATVSFSDLCGHIQPLRYVVLACAAIMSYLIVARSVLQA